MRVFGIAGPNSDRSDLIRDLFPQARQTVPTDSGYECEEKEAYEGVARVLA